MAYAPENIIIYTDIQAYIKEHMVRECGKAPALNIDSV